MRKSGKIVQCKDGYLVYITETLFSSNEQDAVEWLKSEGVKEADINIETEDKKCKKNKSKQMIKESDE